VECKTTNGEAKSSCVTCSLSKFVEVIDEYNESCMGKILKHEDFTVIAKEVSSE
jgi:hypothetical protein